MSKGLVYIGQQIRQINSYFSSNNNWLSTINANLNDIKLAVDPTSSAANFAHPSGSNYSYYTFQDTTSSSNFWVAVNSQLQYLSNRINSIKTSQATISSTVSSMGSSITSIDSNTTSIDGKLPSRNYGYVNSNGVGVNSTDSTYNWWSAMANNFYNTFPKIFSIDSKLPTGYYAYIRQNGTVAPGAYNYWSAVTNSLAYIGEDIHASGLDIDDLHTMFASPEDLALKADQENNISAATSNFLSGSDSATSVGTQSIGKVKDLGDDVSSFFDTGVQATSLFDSLSDTSSDGPWLWFSSAVRDNLTGSQSRSNTKSSSLPGEQVVDYYSDKMAALNKLLGEVSEDD